MMMMRMRMRCGRRIVRQRMISVHTNWTCGGTIVITIITTTARSSRYGLVITKETRVISTMMSIISVMIKSGKRVIMIIISGGRMRSHTQRVGLDVGVTAGVIELGLKRMVLIVVRRILTS